MGAVAVLLALAGCGAERPVVTPSAAPAVLPTGHSPTGNPPTGEAGTTTEIEREVETASPRPDRADGPTGHIDRYPTGRSLRPARLEDVVRPDPALNHEPPEQPAPAAPPNDPAVVETDDLAATLITTVPGFEPIDDDEADRFLDLDTAAGIQPDPTEEQALLETRGYRGGWLRAFRSADNTVAVATVYRFEDATEAEFYLEDGLITIGGYGGKFFDVEGLPGVRGFVQDTDSPSGITAPEERRVEELRSLGAAFNRGDRWYLVYFVGSPDSVTAETLLPTLTSQHELASGAA